MIVVDALIWVGDNAVAALAFGIAAIAVGVIICVAHDIPAPPADEDEHAKNPFRF